MQCSVEVLGVVEVTGRSQAGAHKDQEYMSPDFSSGSSMPDSSLIAVLVVGLSCSSPASEWTSDDKDRGSHIRFPRAEVQQLPQNQG
jgi:hypothetical protein